MPELPCPSAHTERLYEDTRGRQPSTSQAEASQKLNVFGTLILDLDSAELWENEFLLCEWPSRQCILMAAWRLMPCAVLFKKLPSSTFCFWCSCTRHCTGFFSGLNDADHLIQWTDLRTHCVPEISLYWGYGAENETISCPQGVYTLVEKNGNSTGEEAQSPRQVMFHMRDLKFLSLLKRTDQWTSPWP